MSQDAPRKRGRKARNVLPGNRKKPGTAPGPLTPNGKFGRAGHDEALDEARRIIRRRKALEYYLQGMTFIQVAQQLGVSNKTAHGDVIAALDEVKDMRVEVEQWREAQNLQLSMLQRNLMPAALGAIRGKKVKVGKGKAARYVEQPVDPERAARLQVEAVNSIRGLMERRAKLLGLDLQKTDGYSLEQVLGLLRGVTHLFTSLVADPLVRAAFIQGLKQRTGPLAALDTIDVKKEEK